MKTPMHPWYLILIVAIYGLDHQIYRILLGKFRSNVPCFRRGVALSLVKNIGFSPSRRKSICFLRDFVGKVPEFMGNC